MSDKNKKKSATRGEPPSARLAVHAKPRAKTSRVVAIGEIAEIALAAPPVDGAANEELVRFVAKALGLPKSAVSLARGDASRHKQLVIEGLTLEEVHARLGALLASTT